MIFSVQRLCKHAPARPDHSPSELQHIHNKGDEPAVIQPARDGSECSRVEQAGACACLGLPAAGVWQAHE